MAVVRIKIPRAADCLKMADYAEAAGLTYAARELRRIPARYGDYGELGFDEVTALRAALPERMPDRLRALVEEWYEKGRAAEAWEAARPRAYDVAQRLRARTS